jgi:homopolymeric O-antigen transport system permease protein
MAIAQTGFATAEPGDAFGRDLYDGVREWRLWTMLGWSDIRRRYRRSILGPWWITLSMGVTVLALGLLYARLFNQDIESYLPYLTLGFVVWGLIASSMKESCQALSSHGDMIKEVRVPFSIYVLRVVWANLIILMHTIIIIVPVWLYFRHGPDRTALLAIPGLVAITLNLVWIGIALAILNTRFRDVSQMVETVLQVIVFATPIMWPVASIGEHRIVADINPIYHLIELVRAPLLGQAPSPLSWMVALGGAAGGFVLALALLRRCERRIVYWL